MLTFSNKTDHVTKTLELTLEGAIDDDMALPALDLTGIAHFTIDFDLVAAINSMGVKKWMLFLNSSNLDKVHVIFKNCHPAIIEQINLSKSFLPNHGKVESFYADYICESCDHDQEVHFRSVSFDTDNIPDHPCPKCQANMEFDGDEDYYFMFLEFAQ